MNPCLPVLRIADFLLWPLFKLYEIPESLPQRADCVVGLAAGLCADGSPGPVTEAVARRCASLHLSGVSDLVIFTGGYTAGGMTEAQVMSNIVAEMDVAGDKVLLEEESTRTHHHPQLLEPILKGNDVSSMVVVSNHLHARRARAIFMKYYGKSITMYFAKAKSRFGPTAQRRYMSGTTCLIWNVGTHVLAKLKGWA
jgi:hypothetical protein